ncbi:YtfJ family protein [Spirochaetota bacterium]
MSKKITVFCLSALFFIVIISLKGSHAASVGKKVFNVKLADVNRAPKYLPGLGKKVLAIFYTDPRAKDNNNPLASAIKKAVNQGKILRKDYNGIGLANCAAAWYYPNSAIIKAVREKQRKFPKAIYILDLDYSLAKKWGLNKNRTKKASVLIVIGKDKKIKFIKYVKSQSQSSGLIKTVVPLLIKLSKEK